MPLKVIGAGLGRTGTLSLKVALERLGFEKCYHMTEVLSHSGHVPAWDAAAGGEPVDWETLFRGYQATVDWPGCNFYGEYLRLYPEAKVVLTVRDADAWYDSARQTIYFARTAFPTWATLFIPPLRRLGRMVDRLIWDGMFGGRFEDRAHAVEVFHRHNEQVKRSVPPDRLLVYEVSEGWAPLCAFLGVPVPEDTPFPRRNDAAEMRARIRFGGRVVRAVALAVLAALGLILAFVIGRMTSS